MDDNKIGVQSMWYDMDIKPCVSVRELKESWAGS